MIAIRQSEAMEIRKKYGDSVAMTITNHTKKGKRKHYYVEETQKVMYFLDRLRKRQIKKEVPHNA